jgi:hypothetical protein
MPWGVLIYRDIFTSCMCCWSLPDSRDVRIWLSAAGYNTVRYHSFLESAFEQAEVSCPVAEDLKPLFRMQSFG